MLSNYLKIALRFLMRNKVYTLINITGLSVGIACCLLLTLYVNDELSFDTHHHEVENLYRVVTEFESEGETYMHAYSSPPMGPAFMEEIAQVEYSTRLVSPPGVDRSLLRYKEQLYYQEGGFLADSTLFQVFTYDFVEGNPETALQGRHMMVVSDKVAKKIFGDESPIGEIINLNMGGSEGDYTISGVYKSDTYKSFVMPEFIISMNSAGWGDWIASERQWAGQNFVPTFVRLKQGAVVSDVQASMNQLLVKYGSEQLKMLGMKKNLQMEAVSDIYLYNNFNESARITYVKIIFTIAIFLLVLACINFMNLATAKSTRRAAEVGVRKVMGAQRGNLVYQFLGETFVIVSISMGFSLLILEMALPLFNNLSDKNISLWDVNGGFLLGSVLIIILLTALLSGSYPAFYLSSFQPAKVLKSKVSLGTSSGLVRKGLVVFQFIISIALLSGVIIISRQLNYMKEKDLGFATDSRVVIPLLTVEAMQQYDALKTDLAKVSNIRQVAGTLYPPGSFIQNDWSFYKPGTTMDEGVDTRINTVDYDYVEILGQKLLAGRSLSQELDAYGTNRVLVNRMALERLGVKVEEAVGMLLTTDWQDQKISYEIIGVLEDFHHMSLQSEIAPVMYRLRESSENRDGSAISNIIVEVDPTQVSATLAQIEEIWKEQVSFTPFEYNFLDQRMDALYSSARKEAGIITLFMVIAVAISCLGLYGLSMFMAERKTKEIGIRKVLGASVLSIVGNMSREFVVLVLLAFVISIPLTYWAIQYWLEDFAYRISIGADVFVFTALLALGVAILTVLYQSLKAAWANPVESLKDE
ncbi:ABC transporter permease [Cytophagales bacterium LB-30]|uniref:ABC transporter permease n=2 Tax=Shiella aurantiaca TaxID=3058365 RepID=A0ABT8F3S5_9BACT|nr:ABC transporter permease [Shiella aurantiaca]